MIEPKIIVLDFDGVILDSSFECWLRCVDASKLDKTLKSLKFSEEKKNTFLKMRYLVGPAYEFYYLIKSLEFSLEKEKIENQFKIFAKTQKKNAELFSNFFFKSRENAKKKNFAEWIKCNYFFEPMLDLIKRSIYSNKLYIATLKDKKSVIDLLSSRNIFIDKSKVLSLDYGENKFTHLSFILNKYKKVNASEVLYIDDNLNHLMEVCDLGINSRLATWGYCTFDSIKIAKKNNIKTINIRECNEIKLYE